MTAGVVDTTRLAPGTEPIAGPADASSPAIEVLRDITRGGLAGLIVGILLAGIGGRIVMRLAALLVPDADGAFTENGNVVGAITLEGSLALIVFIGLFIGASAGSLWVVMSPWLPQRPAVRAALTVPIALGLGVNGLIEDRNPDFAILGHDPLVVGLLVVLVALFGPALVVVERWLDRRLPHPRPGDTRVIAGYVVVTVLGSFLTLTLVVPSFLGSDVADSGLALIVVGLCTLGWWRFRIQGRTSPPTLLVLGARAALTFATVAGLAVALREVTGALGLR